MPLPGWVVGFVPGVEGGGGMEGASRGPSAPGAVAAVLSYGKVNCVSCKSILLKGTFGTQGNNVPLPVMPAGTPMGVEPLPIGGMAPCMGAVWAGVYNAPGINGL